MTIPRTKNPITKIRMGSRRLVKTLVLFSACCVEFSAPYWSISANLPLASPDLIKWMRIGENIPWYAMAFARELPSLRRISAPSTVFLSTEFERVFFAWWSADRIGIFAATSKDIVPENLAVSNSSSTRPITGIFKQKPSNLTNLTSQIPPTDGTQPTDNKPKINLI